MNLPLSSFGDIPADVIDAMRSAGATHMTCGSRDGRPRTSVVYFWDARDVELAYWTAFSPGRITLVDPKRRHWPAEARRLLRENRCDL